MRLRIYDDLCLVGLYFRSIIKYVNNVGLYFESEYVAGVWKWISRSGWNRALHSQSIFQRWGTPILRCSELVDKPMNNSVIVIIVISPPSTHPRQPKRCSSGAFCVVEPPFGTMIFPLEPPLSSGISQNPGAPFARRLLAPADGCSAWYPARERWNSTDLKIVAPQIFCGCWMMFMIPPKICRIEAYSKNTLWTTLAMGQHQS